METLRKKSEDYRGKAGFWNYQKTAKINGKYNFHQHFTSALDVIVVQFV
jgi:hypothetical protein